MKLTTHIRNLIFLWRQEIPKNADTEVILRVTKNNYKRKYSWVRNQVALLIRKIRKEKPYKIQDYSKAKQFYENQHRGIDFSKVKEGKYIVKFTQEYAVKGKRWCEYHMNFDRGILGIKHYLGDPYIVPDKSFVESVYNSAKKELKENSYTLDIGIDKKGKNYLIEVNDGWAIGNYGLSPKDYYSFVKARWLQLTGVLP